MEKQRILIVETYRNRLADELKNAHSKDTEGRKFAKCLLDAESALLEYKKAKELHHKEIQKMLEKKAEEKRIKLHKDGVKKMKEIIKELPFEYIPIPETPSSHSDAILLKIKDTEVAYLVGNDLKKCGSDYGIKAGNEKIFILCGCSGCKNFNDKFLESLEKTTLKSNIQEVISRYIGDYSTNNFKFKDAGRISKTNIPESVLLNLKEKSLFPTTAPSDSIIKKQEDIRRKEELAREEQRKITEKEEERNMKLLQKAYFLENKFNSGDDSVKKELKKIINESSGVIGDLIINSIDKKLTQSSPNKDLVEKLLPSSVNVLCVSKHDKEESRFHLQTEVSQVNFQKEAEGNLVFEYTEDFETKKYRVVGMRPGLDINCVVVISTPEENKNWSSRKDGSLELYTDIPIVKFLSSSIENKILSEKSNFHDAEHHTWKYKITPEELREKANKELNLRRYNKYGYPRLGYNLWTPGQDFKK
jgi:hypothetical protein